MKNIYFYYLVICLFMASPICAQINADFEMGDFTGWQGKTGYCCPIVANGIGITPDRHTIMSGTGTDPNTCDNVTVVAPGGLYSARLGNYYTGSEAEVLSYTITVTAASALFIYKYAVVLEDPGHDASEQPRFQISVIDSNGVLIDPVCGEYTVVASSDLPDFETCNGSIRYKDWTTVGLDLSSYVGQTVTIEFATGDCSQSGHYGYAYVDAYSSPLAINSSYCSGSFSAMLTAPIGFEYLWSTGETTQSILVNDPAQGLVYECVLTSVTGCTVSISTVMALIDPTADFDIVNTCYNNAIFSNTTDNPGNVNLDGFLWDFGDGTTSAEENPTHVYSGVGTYNVTFTIFNSLGCSSSTSHPVTVFQAPTASISYASSSICSNAGLQIVNLTGTYLYQGGTFEADAGLSIDAITGTIDPLTSIAGTYTVRYVIPTTDDCTVDPATTEVTIVTMPSGTISYSLPAFCTTISNQQSVYQNGIGNLTGGTYSATPLGLQIDAITGAITPSGSQGGTYIVTYTLLGAGCPTITLTTSVVIEEKPNAIVLYDQLAYCNTVVTAVAPVLTGAGNYTGGYFTASPASLNINSLTGEFIPANNIPGTYTITYVIPAGGNCPAIPITTTVSVTAMPTASISYAGPFCHSVTSPQTVQIIGTAAFSGGVYSAPSGLIINQNTGAITPSSSEAGTYTVTYAIPSGGGCSPDPVTTSVAILPLPQPTLSDAVICTDPDGVVFRPALLSTSLPTNGYQYTWYLNNQEIVGETGSTYLATAAGSYSVKVTNSITGCVAPNVFSTVTNSDTVEDFIASITDSFTGNATVVIGIDGGTGPFLYQLNDGEFQSSNTFYNVPSGVHSVSVTDVDNCTDFTKQVIVFGYPKFFTPNGDGANDFWNLTHVNQTDSKIFIYDRLGKLIKQLSPMGMGWDGTFNGRSLPATDYWFVVTFSELDLNGTPISREFKAHFSLKR